MKKTLTLLILLFFGISVNADFQSQSREEIIEELLKKITPTIPVDKPLLINDFTAGFGDEFGYRLRLFLFQEGYSLVEKPSDDFYNLEINYQANDLEKSSGLLRNKFIVKLTESSEGRIIDYQVLEFYSKNANKSIASGNKMKWYEPFFITTLLGGLVYLFYYGNN